MILDDATIYYETYGEGSPLLLIAGLASDSQSWMSIVKPLAENHRVIVYDNRTTGRTTTTEDKLTLEMMVNDAVNLLDHLGIEKADVVGHSMGGSIALMLASSHPERVSRLIIAASPLKISERNRLMMNDFVTMPNYGSAEWFRKLFYWLLTPEFFDNPYVVASALETASGYRYLQSLEGFRKQVQSMDYFDATELCTHIKAPTLVIAGEKDIIFTIDECRRLSKAIEGAKLEIIQGAAHSIHSEKPLEFIQSIESFLR